MQNVQKVIFDRDYALVYEYYERGKRDLEDRKLFFRMVDWFEDKWKQDWVPKEHKRAWER